MRSSVSFDKQLPFVGVVEDDRDPAKHGRVRVRCFGIHPPWNTGEVPTEGLPWAILVDGSFGGMFKLPSIGDWVTGFFMDGRDAQHPFVTGTIPGQALTQMYGTEVPESSGFIKPSEESYKAYGEPPIPKPASGEFLQETVSTLINAARKVGIEIPNESGWEEPESKTTNEPQAATVIQSKDGKSHIVMDSSDEKGSLAINHSSGAQVSINQNGDVKIRSMGDNYNISEGASREYSYDKAVTVEGQYTIHVKDGDCILKVDGDMKQIVKGNLDFEVGGRMTASVGHGFEVQSARMSLKTLAEDINIIGKYTVKIDSLKSDVQIRALIPEGGITPGRIFLTAKDQIHLYSYGDMFQTAVRGHHTTAGTLITEDCDPINMNCGTSSPALPGPWVLKKPMVAEPPDQGFGREQITTNGVGAYSETSTDDGDNATAEAEPFTSTPVEEQINPSLGTMGELLNFIKEHESGGNYNIVYSRISAADRPPKPLTQMTIREVLAWQDSIDAKYQSEASGAYQVLEDTLRGLVNSDPELSLDDKYDTATQDRIAVKLMQGRGLTQFLKGDKKRTDFAINLAREWASIPVVTKTNGHKRVVNRGQSYYAGDGLNSAPGGAQRAPQLENILDNLFERVAGNLNNITTTASNEPAAENKLKTNSDTTTANNTSNPDNWTSKYT